MDAMASVVAESNSVVAEGNSVVAERKPVVAGQASSSSGEYHVASGGGASDNPDNAASSVVAEQPLGNYQGASN